MAHLMAVTLGENRQVINQEVDSEFFEDFEGELDIESLVIGDVEFADVLSSPKTIKQYIEEIEESSELNHPLEAYLACIKRYYEKNTDFDTVRENTENLFVESIEKAPFTDPLKDFSQQKASEWLENFNLPQVGKQMFHSLVEFFDFDSYQTALFINDYDAVELGNAVYFFSKA